MPQMWWTAKRRTSHGRTRNGTTVPGGSMLKRLRMRCPMVLSGCRFGSWGSLTALPAHRLSVWIVGIGCRRGRGRTHLVTELVPHDTKVVGAELVRGIPENLYSWRPLVVGNRPAESWRSILWVISRLPRIRSPAVPRPLNRTTKWSPGARRHHPISAADLRTTSHDHAQGLPRHHCGQKTPPTK